MYKMKEGKQYLRLRQGEILPKDEVIDFIATGSNWIYPFNEAGWDMSKSPVSLVVDVLPTKLLRVMYE